MKINHIVATSIDYCIGDNGEIPWKSSLDFKLFKQKTVGVEGSNNAILMGRKTHESIGRFLPGRMNVVVSRNPDFAPFGASFLVDSVKSGIELCKSRGIHTLWIIGGGEIYNQTQDLCDEIHLTMVGMTMPAGQGDAFYPGVPLSSFKEVSRSHATDNGLFLSFIVFEKIA